MARATCGDAPQRNRLALCLVQFFFVDLSEQQKPNFPALNNEPDPLAGNAPFGIDTGSRIP
jgi:hypothetical protein